MKPKVRLLLALIAGLAIVSLSLVRREDTALSNAASYTGTTSIDGQVRLDLSVSPPVGSPRDTLQLRIRVTNNTSSFISPEVQLQLPTMLQVSPDQMPAGVTDNISNNKIQWLPLVPSSGESREIILPLMVSSADLTNPEQQISVQLSTDQGVQQASTLLWIGIPPRVEGFDLSSHVSVGQQLQLKPRTQGPRPYTESWDLGDGRIVAVNNPTIVYPTAGVYNVKVTVKNPVGETSYSAPITVVPHVTAKFSAGDDTPGLGQEVAFTNTGGGQQPVQYRWDFGDGSTSADAHPSHIFSNPGTYNVKLIAENAFGISETSQLVTVGSPPKADIMVAESAPAGTHLAGEVVLANGQSADTEYSWEMGDGRHYNSAKISHAYRQTGDYYVTMTARNEFGETQVGRWIHVEEGIQQVYIPMVSNAGGLVQGSSTDSMVLPAGTSVLDVAIDAPFVMDPIEFSALTPPTDRLLAYINEARRQFELSELIVSSELSAAAHKQANDMATAKHNQHIGSDGSKPADRFLEFGYEKGYAGEATAWGFADPRQAVEFWVNSPGHRPIILNPYASEVGLGYEVDYTAPSVWYWTAEFGNVSATADTPELRIQTPDSNLETLNSEQLIFSWNWPTSLAPSEKFTVYFNGSNGSFPIESVNEPAFGTLYRLAFTPVSNPGLLGEFQWQVKLENSQGAEFAASEPRALTIALDPDLPTPTPEPTLLPTVTPTPSPTVSPTVVPTTQPPTPRPTDPPLAPFVTATPLPVEP
jgi:PKD repeat protein